MLVNYLISKATDGFIGCLGGGGGGVGALSSPSLTGTLSKSGDISLL